jgi:GntR family transcriptional regulator
MSGTDDSSLPVTSLTALDPDSAIPRYRQISDQLARLVQDMRPGLRLPSEHELMRHLGVSRATATQALRDLEQRGLVHRRQGRGTFVADIDRAIRSNASSTLPSFSEDLRKAGRSTSERVIAINRMTAPYDVASTLGLSETDSVWRIERVIVSDGEPVVHLTSWLPVAVFPALDSSSIEASSLYEQLERTPGSPGRPCFADEHWSAASAPKATAALLEIPSNVPVMRVLRTAYLADQSPAEFVISYVRGETFAVFMRIGGDRSTAGRVLEHVAIRES